jgi:hypothetical protein
VYIDSLLVPWLERGEPRPSERGFMIQYHPHVSEDCETQWRLGYTLGEELPSELVPIADTILQVGSIVTSMSISILLGG